MWGPPPFFFSVGFGAGAGALGSAFGAGTDAGVFAFRSFFAGTAFFSSSAIQFTSRLRVHAEAHIPMRDRRGLAAAAPPNGSAYINMLDEQWSFRLRQWPTG